MLGLRAHHQPQSRQPAPIADTLDDVRRCSGAQGSRLPDQQVFSPARSPWSSRACRWNGPSLETAICDAVVVGTHIGYALGGHAVDPDPASITLTPRIGATKNVDSLRLDDAVPP